MKTLLHLFPFSLIFPFAVALGSDSYKIETISFPDDLPAEVGAIDFDSNGDLYVAVRRGDILFAKPAEDPKAFEWRHFANGFHNPCGIFVMSPGHIIISQMAELTEVIDTDKDGVADQYNSLSTEFGLSGNYHETMDICPDGEGGLYLAPGTASHNGPTFDTPRGEYSKVGRLGRNFSSVKWRGWVLHWNREQGLTPISSGYRMHNGIERAPDGTVWCGDNQGDWRTSSPVYHVSDDSFAGHPSSLIWDERFSEIGNPLMLPRILLDDLWNKPAFRLSRGMMNSCAEPVFDTTGGKFGPFEGQMLIPDQSGSRIVRLMREKVDGAWQGAARMFISGDGLQRGNNRLAFSSEEDTLYVGQTGRGWGKLSEGLQRIRYTGEIPFEILNCNLTNEGFRLEFTKPVDVPDSMKLERYRYRYGYKYGGPEEEKKSIAIGSIVPDPDKPSILHLKIASPDEFVANHMYRISLDGIRARGSDEVLKGGLDYTLNRMVRPDSKHKVTIEKANDGYRIEIDGKLFTEYRTSGFSNPILYPIINEAGTELTRDWPIRDDGRKNEEKDHPHHKSLFIGHQSVNGIDFWHEDGKCGMIEHARTIETRSGEDRALIRTYNQWKDSKGEVIGSDTREIQFGIADGARFIDLELNIHASHQDLKFKAMKDGLIGLRTHPDLRLSPAPGKGVEKVFGSAENSEGITGRTIWGKRANWIHFYGKADGTDAGVAILAHPGNPRSPTWWHARDYGLLAANPFAPEKIGGNGDLQLSKGNTLTLRYRFLFHDFPADNINLAKHYESYASRRLVPRSLTTPIPLEPTKPEEIVVPENVIPRGSVISEVSRMVNGKKAKSPKVATHGFFEGASIYGDRDYRFARLPEYLRGGDLVMTFNDDKKDGRSAVYEVTIKEPGMLHLLVDTRAEKSLKWLNSKDTKLEFEKTTDLVRTDSDYEYRVYTAEVDPGAYQLGDQNDSSFYVLVGVNRD